MQNADWRSIFIALLASMEVAGIDVTPRQMVDLTDRMVKGGMSFINPDYPDDKSHDALVNKLLTHPALLHHLSMGKRVLAIKDLRTFTGVGIKAAVDAVNDPRVLAHFPRITAENKD